MKGSLLSGSSGSDENRATELGEISRGLKALEHELDLVCQALGEAPQVSQLHFGGGTPTYLDDDELRHVVGMIAASKNPQAGAAQHPVAQHRRGGLLDAGLRIRTLTLPDIFQDHDTPEKMYELAGLDARSIAASAIKALGRGDERALKLIVG